MCRVRWLESRQPPVRVPVLTRLRGCPLIAFCVVNWASQALRPGPELIQLPSDASFGRLARSPVHLETPGRTRCPSVRGCTHISPRDALRLVPSISCVVTSRSSRSKARSTDIRSANVSARPAGTRDVAIWQERTTTKAPAAARRLGPIAVLPRVSSRNEYELVHRGARPVLLVLDETERADQGPDLEFRRNPRTQHSCATGHPTIFENPDRGRDLNALISAVSG